MLHFLMFYKVGEVFAYYTLRRSRDVAFYSVTRELPYVSS